MNKISRFYCRRSLILAFCIVAGLTIHTISYAQSDTSDTLLTSSRIVCKPAFWGARLNLTSLIFINSFGGSVDINLIRFNFETETFFGVRADVEAISVGSIGGPVGNSPYLEYSLLARHTIDGGTLRLDVYAGYTYCINDYTSDNYAFGKSSVKGGVEVRWFFAKPVLSILAKVSGSKYSGPAPGIGLSLGWN